MLLLNLTDLHTLSLSYLQSLLFVSFSIFDISTHSKPDLLIVAIDFILLSTFYTLYACLTYSRCYFELTIVFAIIVDRSYVVVVVTILICLLRLVIICNLFPSSLLLIVIDFAIVML